MTKGKRTKAMHCDTKENFLLMLAHQSWNSEFNEECKRQYREGSLTGADVWNALLEIGSKFGLVEYVSETEAEDEDDEDDEDDDDEDEDDEPHAFPARRIRQPFEWSDEMIAKGFIDSDMPNIREPKVRAVKYIEDISEYRWTIEQLSTDQKRFWKAIRDSYDIWLQRENA